MDSILDIDSSLIIPTILLFICSFTMTQLSLRCVTEIARETKLDTPLPDIYHRALPHTMREYHEYADWMPIIPLFLFIFLDRFKNAGIFLFLIGILYLMRAISFSLTVLPSPETNCKCEWEHEPETFLRKILNFIYQEGCNDLIFSGHTAMMLMSSLFLSWYCSDVYNNIFAKLLLVLYNILGVIVIIGTRLHYSVDTYISTIITTLLFFSFHPPKKS